MALQRFLFLIKSSSKTQTATKIQPVLIPLHKNLLESVHNFLSHVAYKETNKLINHSIALNLDQLGLSLLENIYGLVSARLPQKGS